MNYYTFNSLGFKRSVENDASFLFVVTYEITNNNLIYEFKFRFNFKNHL